ASPRLTYRRLSSATYRRLSSATTAVPPRLPTAWPLLRYLRRLSSPPTAPLLGYLPPPSSLPTAASLGYLPPPLSRLPPARPASPGYLPPPSSLPTANVTPLLRLLPPLSSGYYRRLSSATYRRLSSGYYPPLSSATLTAPLLGLPTPPLSATTLPSPPSPPRLPTATYAVLLGYSSASSSATTPPLPATYRRPLSASYPTSCCLLLATSTARLSSGYLPYLPPSLLGTYRPLSSVPTGSLGYLPPPLLGYLPPPLPRLPTAASPRPLPRSYRPLLVSWLLSATYRRPSATLPPAPRLLRYLPPSLLGYLPPPLLVTYRPPLLGYLAAASPWLPTAALSATYQPPLPRLSSAYLPPLSSPLLGYYRYLPPPFLGYLPPPLLANLPPPFSAPSRLSRLPTATYRLSLSYLPPLSSATTAALLGSYLPLPTSPPLLATYRRLSSATYPARSTPRALPPPLLGYLPPPLSSATYRHLPPALLGYLPRASPRLSTAASSATYHLPTAGLLLGYLPPPPRSTYRRPPRLPTAASPRLPTAASPRLPTAASSATYRPPSSATYRRLLLGYLPRLSSRLATYRRLLLGTTAVSPQPTYAASPQLPLPPPLLGLPTPPLLGYLRRSPRLPTAAPPQLLPP
ncbi:uncharacterized protein, partial [Salvelinus sp. IW2-2015]|uniref:uncharacterized protein n=1 Tax=Salvelinus sp. IW2-2015 TaxID=2691554 RepID=UPI000CEAC46A